MAEAPIYCTHKELKRVYPQVSSFDTKIPIYGWVLGKDNFDGSALDLYYSQNSGLVTQLYWGGLEVEPLTFPPIAQTLIDETFTSVDTTLTVDADHGIVAFDVLKIDNEYLRVTSVSTNDLTVERGLAGTPAAPHDNNSSVYLVIDRSELATPGVVTTPVCFVYDSDMDMCLLVTTALDPNDYVVEAGEDFATLVTQFRTDASRFLDSKLDPNLPREQLKDKSGNFDYMIIRSAALIAATFMIRASDPTNEVATALMEEAQGNIDALNSGNAALSWQTTRDSSRGIIRDVTYIKERIRPVETRGVWSGTFDLVKVKIGTGGALGTATYNVYVKDADNLKQTQVVTEKIINGDYQELAGGLQIRFAGEDDASVATANNEWEIEVMGESEYIDIGRGSIQLTRGGYGV